ncbi:MAG: hypothetical protein ACOYNB_05665 [Aquabacterium sp.]|uniref:hypothetical protein n=1 Tax=Aquabacterium sp. TaxID=1872578 RepID=UPI003BCDD968
MTTYARTALGKAALSSNSADLPRKLRTLLIAIDGRTDSTAFERNLSSFGDVSALLDSLKTAGYIEESNAGLFRSNPNPKLTKSGSPRLARSSASSSDFRAGDGRFASEFRAYRAVSQTYQPANGAMFAGGGDEKASLANAQLKAAVSLMSDFVAEHLPAQALEIVIELEPLSSVEALIRSLDDYEQLIKPAGTDKGLKHMRELRAILTSE